MKDIFERDMAGEPVSIDEPEYYKINEQIIKAQKISAELNCGYKTPEEVRALIAELTGTEPNETLRLIPPFQSGFGRNLRFGHQVFVNTGCFFMDRGGITIGDDVFIGPKVQLITTNHGTAPSQRPGHRFPPHRHRQECVAGSRGHCAAGGDHRGEQHHWGRFGGEP